MRHQQAQQQSGCGRFISVIVGLGFSLVMMAVGLGFVLYESSPDVKGTVHTYTWDGKSTLLCDGLTNMNITGKKIRVLSYRIHLSAASTVTFKSATTAITGAMTAVANGNLVIAAEFNPAGHFDTAVAAALNLTNSTGTATGHLTYQEID